MKTHGMTGTSIYKIWTGMLERCRGVGGRRNRKYYLDKGIKVCERWHSFDNFVADMGDRPSPEHSIDRIDSNGDYAPANCRWATDTEQNRNRSNTRFLTINGITKPLTQWAEDVGVAAGAIRQRLRRGLMGADLIRPKRIGHELNCPAPVTSCTCAARRRYDRTEKFLNLLARKRGRTLEIRTIARRVGIKQEDAIELCRQSGLTVVPSSPTQKGTYARLGRSFVVVPQNDVKDN